VRTVGFDKLSPNGVVKAGFDKLSPNGEAGFDKLSPNGEAGLDKLSPNGGVCRRSGAIHRPLMRGLHA
jgi:hypothetical protein